jgi:hypothetical protein
VACQPIIGPALPATQRSMSTPVVETIQSVVKCWVLGGSTGFDVYEPVKSPIRHVATNCAQS